VRDIRIGWALEEAGLPYRVKSVPFRARNAQHFAHQPFGQLPWFSDGDISIIESGAILLHLDERSEALMPADPRGRSEVLEWLFAALNSVEMASLPWSIFNSQVTPPILRGGSIWTRSSMAGFSTWTSRMRSARVTGEVISAVAAGAHRVHYDIRELV
jgi:glutathione S-transferase